MMHVPVVGEHGKALLTSPPRALRGERAYQGGPMDYVKLRNLLLSRGQAHQSDCVKLSATKYIRASDWEQLKRYEQNYLKCYASGTAAHTGLLVGRSAGQFLGLWILPLKEEFVELAHTSGKPPSSTQWPPGVIYRHIPIASMDYQEFEAVDGTGSSFLRATTVERTIVDIARLHGLRHGVAALDSWLEGEAPMNVQVKQNQIAATIARLTGKKGIAVAREALAKSISLSESPYESLFRIILTEHGITTQPQMRIGHRVRVDLLWDQLVIEIDGAMKFEDLPHETVMKQLRRENWLREQGYEVIRLFPADILRDEDDCVQRVITAYRRSQNRGPILTPARTSRSL